MTVIRFQRFVRFYLGQNLVVTFRIFAGNERRHAAHRERAAFMTGFNQQTRIGAEEWLIHRHHLTVRQHAIRVVLQRFDIAKNVVPTTAVQTHNVVTQGVQNFVHLEDGRQRFNQQGRFNGTARQVKAVLCIAEHFAPPCRFLPGLRFWQIEIRAAAFRQQRFVVVEEIEGKVEQAARDRFATPGDVFFRQVQTTNATYQQSRIRFELINFTRFVGVANGAIDRIAQVDLPVDNFAPLRSQRIFKISHKDFDVRVQRVDDHLALNRSGNLYAAIQ